jgi:hypothetical protein
MSLYYPVLMFLIVIRIMKILLIASRELLNNRNLVESIHKKLLHQLSTKITRLRLPGFLKDNKTIVLELINNS